MDKMDESQILVEMLCRDNWENGWIKSIDFEKLIRLAKKNLVLSSLAHFIFEKNIDHFFRESSVYPILKESLLLNQRDTFVYKKTLNHIKKTFSEINIDICLLKGLSLPWKIPRDMGDLDLLVYEKDLLPAIEAMENLGFSYQGYRRNRFIKNSEFRNWKKLMTWSNQFEFLDQKTGLLVELHTNFFEQYRVYHINLDLFLGKINEFRERSLWSAELECKTLSLEDKVWLLSIHNSLKRSVSKNSFVLRNVLDMRYLLKSGQIRWDELIKRALETDTLVFLMYSLEMTNSFFSDLLLEEPLSRGNSLLTVKGKVLKRSLHNCFYNLETINFFKRFVFQMILPFFQKSRLSHKFGSLLILPVLFPPVKRLKELYNLPRWMFPVFYLIEPLRWINMAIYKIKSRKTELYFTHNQDSNHAE